MKRRCSIVGVVVIALALASTSVFCQGMMRRGRGMGMGMGHGRHMGGYGMQGRVPGLSRNPLTSEQRDRIVAIRRQTQKQVREVRWDSSLTESQKAEKIAEMRRKGHDEATSVLSLTQQRELQGWWKCRAGIGTGAGMGRGPGRMGYGMQGHMPGLREHPLAAEQRDRIAAIRQETRTSVHGIRIDSTLSQGDRSAKIAEAWRQGHEKVMGVLTSEQRQEFASWWQSRARRCRAM